MSFFLTEKEVERIRLDMQKVVQISGQDIDYKRFESTNVQDPLYGERSTKEVLYRTVRVKAVVRFNPRTWITDELGNRKSIDAEFVIAAKTLDDLLITPVSAKDRIFYRGQLYMIMQIQEGDLPLGKTINYLFRCLKNVGI